jgi:hypothetical protein
VLVIANVGNAQLSEIWAAAAAVPQPPAGRNAGANPPTRSTAVRVGRLAPGASEVLTLPRLKVRPGETYTLWTSVGTGALPQGPVTTPSNGVGQIDEVSIKVASG